jgi:hypothetical protein
MLPAVFPYGEQLPAALANLGLALKSGQRRIGLFLEKQRKDQQRIRRHPGQRGCLSCSVPEIPIQTRLWHGGEALKKQLVFKPFKSRFPAAKRRRGRNPHIKTSLSSKLGGHLIVSSIHVVPFCFRREFHGITPIKNPRLTGNRGFFGNLVNSLEVSSRDADGAVPHGRTSIDSLVTQTNCKVTLHVLTAVINTGRHWLSSAYWVGLRGITDLDQCLSNSGNIALNQPL